METATTIIAGAETVANQPRAAAEMGAAIGKTPRRRPGKREREAAKAPAAATTPPKAADAPIAAVPLAELLSQRRNAFVEANWSYADGDEQAGDAAQSEMSRLETVILGSDAVSLDDVIAKLAMVAAHDREGLCFDRDLLYGITLEAQAMFLKSAAPGDILPAARQGYWMFVPTETAVPPKLQERDDRPASPSGARPVIKSARWTSGELVSALVDAKTPLDDPRMIAAIAENGQNWLDHMLGSNLEPPAGISPEYAARRADAIALWKLDQGHGGVADYGAEPTGDAYTDACIERVNLCQKAAQAAFTVLQNTRATNMAELLDKEVLLCAFNGEEDRPDWYRADVEALTDGKPNMPAPAGPDAPAPSTTIAALADQMDRIWSEERVMWESDHTDEEAEAVVARTGAVAHQLMGLPAATLDDFRAKARAIEWALSGTWDTWPYIGTFGDFAKTLVLELLGDARRRELLDVQPSAPAAEPPEALQPIADGHAVSPKLPDPTTPFALAVALRDQLRAEVQAYEDQHDATAPQELRDRVSDAEFAMYEAPASNLDEVLWKLGENMMEENTGFTHAEGLANAEKEYDLGAAAQVGVYRDLQRLIWDEMWAQGYPLSEKLAADLPLLNDIEAAQKVLSEARRAADGATADALYVEYDKILDRILPTRPQTIAALASKVTMIEALGSDLTEAPEDRLPLSDQIVRSVLRDVKAMFRAPEVSITGSKALTALWTAAAIKARHEKAAELLAAE